MAERLKASVLKTEVRKYREFESHSLRQIQKCVCDALLSPFAHGIRRVMGRERNNGVHGAEIVLRLRRTALGLPRSIL